MSRETRFLELPSREQVSLYGSSLREAVAEAPEVLALDAAFAELDYSAWEAEDPGTGAPSYPARVLLGVYIYALSLGLRSSRVIEGMCRLHAGFRFLAFGLVPDHNTLCRFRARSAEQLREAFRETVRVCQRDGLVSLARVAVDGTKLRANRGRRALAKAEAAFAEALEEAALVDDQEGEAQAAAAAAQECALMKTTAGVHPAYNVQVAVEESHQVIVAQEVTTQANDAGQLHPLLEQVQETCGAWPEQGLGDGGYFVQKDVVALEKQGVAIYVPVSAGGLGRMGWDAGVQAYRCPKGELLTFYRERDGKHVYRCVRCGRCRQKKGCGVTGRSKELHVIPEAQESLARLAARVGSEEGKIIYATRSGIVEPVFAHAKVARRFQRFLLRGREKAGAEWSLLCILHNLRKWVQHVWTPRGEAEAAARRPLASPGGAFGALRSAHWHQRALRWPDRLTAALRATRNGLASSLPVALRAA